MRAPPPAAIPGASAPQAYGPAGIGLGFPRSASGEPLPQAGAPAEEPAAYEDVTEKRVTELQNLIQRGEEDCVSLTSRRLSPPPVWTLD